MGVTWTLYDMLTSIDVKFPSILIAGFSASSGDNGKISSADILQIADVVR